MFRIRRVFDDALKRDKDAIYQAQEILRTQFSALTIDEIEKLPHMLKNPLKYSFRTILFVADDYNRKINGFAVLNHDHDLNFCYLDFLSIHPDVSSRGIGGALYERVRAEANELGTLGIFFECLPDDPNLCREPETLKQNKKRLRFYENYKAYPIINTKYETPLKPESDCPPYLVFDPLGQDPKLPADKARLIVKTILEKKYASACPPGYIDMVIASFKDDPVKLRQPKYKKKRHNPLSSCLNQLNRELRLSLQICMKSITSVTADMSKLRRGFPVFCRGSGCLDSSILLNRNFFQKNI